VSRPAGDEPVAPELDAELAKAALVYVRAGTPPEVACAAVGIAPSTFHSWWQRGDPTGTDPADLPFRQFRDQVAVEEAKGEARLVTLVAQSANEVYGAAIWLLERRYAPRWARVSQRSAAEGGEQVPEPFDPFSEVDELARRRAGQSRAGDA